MIQQKRAFETVDRKRMIMKLEEYGIINNELNWFANFLNNRKQKTKYKNQISNEIIVPIGLPQGTSLSVILFVLYINDIVRVPKYSKIVMFADDTALIIKSNNVNDAISKMNEDMIAVFNWLNINKLVLNINKTKWMAYGIKNDDTI